jgi:hypothetical protein
LSENYKTVDHSFSGTPEQKSTATVILFNKAFKIEFLPKQILNVFPKLNGIMIQNSDNFTVLRNDLFTKDFGAIQYLSLYGNKITTIEANAFQHLPKLKWIGLWNNQLRSLPHQIFKNNPELISIWLHGNKINSTTPDFLRNLNKLQFVRFDSNQCTNKVFGCTSGCSVSQEELDSGLSGCYSNCLADGECAARSGKLDNLSSEQIRNNMDLIISSGHAATLIEKGYSNLLVEKFSNINLETASKLKTVQEEIIKVRNETLKSKASLLKAISNNADRIKSTLKEFGDISQDLRVQKGTVESLGKSLALLNQSNADNLSSLEKTVLKKIHENAAVFDDRLNRTVQEVQEESRKIAENCEKVKLELIERNEMTISLFKENSTKALEANKEEVKDLTKTLVLQMENERLQSKLAEAKYTIDKLSMESELKTLKQEMCELKTAKLEENKQNFEQKISEILQKKLDEFERKLMEESRP